MKKKFRLMRGWQNNVKLRKIWMTMKLTTFLFLFAIAQMMASETYSQSTKLTLQMKDATVKEVLNQIEEKSEYFFLYNSKLIDVNRSISIDVKEERISELLSQLFPKNEVAFFVVDRQIILSPQKNVNEKQQQKISGTVSDASTGEPIIGANIVIEGTTLGAVTDANGAFSLDIPNSNVVLVISFIGYNTEKVQYTGQSAMDIKLVPDITKLEEIVVIGYGTKARETLTGSIAAISSKDILTTKTNSVAEMMQGKVPGLMIRRRTGEPGVFNSYVSIRGFGTPLLVIDGVLRDGMSDFEKLNPEDIESISVLKDAAAAIYGMNADNGVIIVTTKSGAKGKTRVNVNSTYSFKQPTTGDLQNTVDAYTFRVLKNEMSRNSREPEPYPASELEKWKAGTEPGYQDFDWYKACIRDWTDSWLHDISVTGGTEKSTHYTSFSFMNDKGLAHDRSNQYYKNFNLRSSFTTEFAKGFTGKFIVNGKYDRNQTNVGGYYWTFKQIIVSDRGIAPHPLDGNLNHWTSVPAENVNPIAQQRRDLTGGVTNENYQYQLTMDLKYDLPAVKGLSFGVLGAFDGNILEYSRVSLAQQLYDYKTGEPSGGKGLSRLQQRMTHFNRKYLNSKISYKNTFGENHNVDALLVHELRLLQTKYIAGRRQYDNLFTHDILDQASLTNQSTGGSLKEEAFMSYVGRFNYDFKRKYLLELSFRRDGSYRYAPEKRWAFFPAVSAGWRVSEESFIKNNLELISNLKFRASYGLMGADAGNPFQYIPGYSFSNIAGGAVLNPNTLTLGTVPPGVVNDNLTWIKTTTANVGIDLELWNGKFGISGDYFQKNRNGLLATRVTAVPNTFGASFPEENLNSDEIKGVELVISHKNTISKFNYGISANMTYSRRYLQHVERSPYRSSWEKWKDDFSGDGRVMGRLWTHEWDGFYSSVTEYENAPLIGWTVGNSYGLPGAQRIVDVDGNGKIDENDQLPNNWDYDINPPLQYGANIYFSWRNFDFNTLLQGAALFSFPISNGDTWGYNRYPSTWTFYLDRWRTADPQANPYDPATEWIPGKYEALMNNFWGTTIDYRSSWNNPICNYLRIKSMEIGYTLPNELAKKIKLYNARFSLNVTNLYTFSRKELKIFDPEREVGDWWAGGTYPIMRSFNFSIQVTL